MLRPKIFHERNNMKNKNKIELLNKAIDLAQGPGKCQYVIDDKPGCVIGQLCALQGVEIAQMSTWARWMFVSPPSTRDINQKFIPYDMSGGVKEIFNKQFERDLLQELQTMWDRTRTFTKDVPHLKAEMKQMVLEMYEMQASDSI
jgi:hypothetical protein